MSESVHKHSASEDGHVVEESSKVDVGKQLHHPKNWLNLRVIVNAVIIGLSLGLYGYDNVFVGPLVTLPLFVLKCQGPGVDGLPVFDARNLTLMVTVPLVGAALGSFGVVPIQGPIGRKGAFLAAYGFLFENVELTRGQVGHGIVNQMLLVQAQDGMTNILEDFGISILTNVAPIWLSELMPAHVRGRSVGFAVAGIGIVGVMAAVIVWGTEQISDERQYQIPLAIQAGVPCVLCLLTLLASESPVWLLSKDRNELARKNMLSLRNHNVQVTDAELALQSIALKQKDEARATTRWMDILNKHNFERTLMSGYPTSAGQASGAALVGTYGTVLLVEAGITNAYEVTIIVTVVQFVGSCVAPYLYDRLGRRPVALSVYALITILSAVLGGLAYTDLLETSQRNAFAALTIILAFVNAITSALGFLVATEVPTASLREPTMTWATFWGYVTSVCTTFIIPQIISAGAGDLGPKAYLIFMGTTIVIEGILYFFLPERRTGHWLRSTSYTKRNFRRGSGRAMNAMS
ncbi:MFS general substrate transporter [Dacryopinax primogenitus]|uniref:MFS general substrate transporter n=1 Tax=Dacryopinax primogenitus (strain DJM 731) TaxID=1858805 RepID=M5FVK9_DACPD|nr:MFS general substrate transporter [Dacryopinax primogenitus]EJT97376.1 MFS general substrate transporter [Dacryopinax primogenitus]